MLRTHRLLATVTLATGLAASPAFAAQSTPAGATSSSDSAALHRLFENYFERQLQLNPLLATFIGDHRYDDQLTNNISPEHIAIALDVDRKALQSAQKLAAGQLSESDRLSVEILMHDLRASLEGAKFPGELAPINQFQSLPTLMPVLGSGSSAQPFATAADYDRFLKRMRDYVVWSDQAIVNMRKGLAQDLTYPRVLMEKVLPQLKELIVADPEASLFYTPLKKFPDAVPAGDRTRLQAAYRDAIARQINPAYQRLHDFIRDEYLKGARTQVGWSNVPNGRAWYAYLARLSTTTDLSPDAIHELGLKEVARIRGEMEAIRKQVGFNGTLEEFFTHLRTDPKFFYKTGEELLDGYRAVAKRIDPELIKISRKLPRVPYGVVPIPDAIAPMSPTAFANGGAPDGSRPPYFFANLYKPETRPKWEMMALTLHEAMPGHCMQISIAQELGDLPQFRRHAFFTAYVEGWGLYAESLGEDMGLYKDDPYAKFGQLTYEMWRAVRLVVDTGIHAMEWERERAIKYFMDNAAKTENDVTNEIDRYISVPGQALAYKMGELKIKELRRKAESTLGEKFDLRDFNDVVLQSGALPLDILERRVDEWLTGRP